MSLKVFLNQMEEEGKVLHVKEEVSPRFEVPYLIKKLEREAPVILFEKVQDSESKIVANVCGTRERLCEALNVKRNQLYKKIVEAWRSPKKPEISGASQRKSIEKPDLSQFPILTHFKKDGGPYITSAVIYAKTPDKTTGNASIHRLQVLDNRRLAIRLVPRHLYELWSMAKQNGEDLDVSISIGVHPAVMLAASSPLPLGVDEFEVANALMNNNLNLVDCEDVDAYAPAEAELVLEGKISTSEETVEGPFVDVTGTYDTKRSQPIVEVISATQRENFVYQSILPSGVEHRLLMGLPREVLIWESVSKVVPKVKAVNLSVGGSGWLHAFVSITKQSEGDGKNALLAIFAAHPSLKHAVVVDSDINVYDVSDVEWAIATRFQANKDLITIENVRGSSLDSSADQETSLTTKVGVDATFPLNKSKENFERSQIPVGDRTKNLLLKLINRCRREYF